MVVVCTHSYSSSLTFIKCLQICLVFKVINPLPHRLCIIVQCFLFLLKSHGHIKLTLLPGNIFLSGRLCCFYIGLSLLIIKLSVEELVFFLEPRNLPLRFILIEGLFSHKLATQVLDLEGQLPLNSINFLSHDVSPNTIKLIENLRNARFRHFAIVLCPYLLDFLYCFCGDPLICIMVLLKLLSSRHLIGLNAKLVAHLGDALVAEALSPPHNIGIRYILIISGLFKELDKLLIIGLKVIKFNMHRSFALSRAIEICNSLLEICDLVSKTVVFSRLKL